MVSHPKEREKLILIEMNSGTLRWVKVDKCIILKDESNFRIIIKVDIMKPKNVSCKKMKSQATFNRQLT